MKNLGYFINKIIRTIDRPSLKNCKIAKKTYVGPGSRLTNTLLGKYSYIGKNCVIINADIGNYCSIASYCSFGGTGHNYNYFSTSPVFYKGKNVFHKNFLNLESGLSKKIYIGNDVWIGEKVYIKEGIRIGNGVVIGAHSVVLNDVPDFAIIAGVPAKIIKFRFNESLREKYLNDCWWNLSEDELKEYLKAQKDLLL